LKTVMCFVSLPSRVRVQTLKVRTQVHAVELGIHMCEVPILDIRQDTDYSKIFVVLFSL